MIRVWVAVDEGAACPLSLKRQNRKFPASPENMLFHLEPSNVTPVADLAKSRGAVELRGTEPVKFPSASTPVPMAYMNAGTLAVELMT
jgi:hypothetical protein